jgi:hypothetical protein
MFAGFYQSLPDYDPRKSMVKEAYNTWIEEGKKQWTPALSTLISFNFQDDNLKVVE